MTRVGHKDGLLACTPASGHADWLTGGKFGPDGSVLAFVAGVVVMGATLAIHRRARR